MAGAPASKEYRLKGDNLALQPTSDQLATCSTSAEWCPPIILRSSPAKSDFGGDVHKLAACFLSP